jgi:hypothetical protein
MTELEDRLRRDLSMLAARATLDSIRPLEVPVRTRRSLAVRWLAPATAAVAVLAVITCVSLAGRDAGQRLPPRAVAAGMPPYYVTVNDKPDGTKTSRAALSVRSSATGGVRASLLLPRPQQGQLWISGAADDRTFVLSEGYRTYLLLQLSADGRIARLSHLPTRFFAFQSQPGMILYSLAGALSPDGRDIAFATNSCPRPGKGAPLTCQFGIRVVSLATGASKTWTDSWGPKKQLGLPFILQPSWGDNGREIAFGQLVPSSPGLADYRLLNVAGTSGSLLADSRPILSAPVAAPDQAAQLTPDGRALILPDYTNANAPGQDGRGVAYLGVVERSVPTGRVLRILHVAKSFYDNNSLRSQLADWADADCDVLSLGPTGLHALVQCNGFGRLDGSHFTPLPGVPSAEANYDSSFNVDGIGSGGTAAW